METENEKLLKAAQTMIEHIVKVCDGEDADRDSTSFTRDSLDIGVSGTALALAQFIAGIMVRDYMLGSYLRTLVLAAVNERLPFIYSELMAQTYLKPHTLEKPE